MPDDHVGVRTPLANPQFPSRRSIALTIALVVFAGLALSISDGRIDVSAFLLYAGVPAIHRRYLGRRPGD